MTSKPFKILFALAVTMLAGCHTNEQQVTNDPTDAGLVSCVSKVDHDKFSYYKYNEKTYYYQDLEKVKQWDIVDVKAKKHHLNEFSMRNYECTQIASDAK